MTDELLRRAAREFAEELTATVQTVLPTQEAFTAKALGEKSKVVVRQAPESGIPMFSGGVELLTLKARFDCVLDRANQFLAVSTSSISVQPASALKHPLFRYEFERAAHSSPAAHLHVHAHRDAFTHVMTLSHAGRDRRRSKERAKPLPVPTMQNLHFPLGGHRYRPCLEDVLDLLISDFGVDHQGAQAIEALAEGRRRWRQTQLRAAMRDDPETAAALLRELGYEVTREAGAEALEPNMNRLRAP